MGEGRRDCHYSACCLSWEWVWASAGRVWGLDYCPLCSPGSWSASHGVQSVGSSLRWWEMAQGFLFCVCQELLHFLGVFVRDHTGVTALEVQAELGWWQAVCVGGRKTTRMATGGEKKKTFSHITYRIIAWILTWLAFKFKLKTWVHLFLLLFLLPLWFCRRHFKAHISVLSSFLPPVVTIPQNNDLSVLFRVTSLVRFAQKCFIILEAEFSVWSNVSGKFSLAQRLN